MKTCKLFKVHNKLVDALGEELVVSLILDNAHTYIAVSTYKSNLEFKTNRPIQTCEITDEDLSRDIDVFADEVIEIYKNILYLPEGIDDIENPIGITDETE